jgi:hypothetical protein
MCEEARSQLRQALLDCNDDSVILMPNPLEDCDILGYGF